MHCGFSSDPLTQKPSSIGTPVTLTYSSVTGMLDAFNLTVGALRHADLDARLRPMRETAGVLRLRGLLAQALERL